MSDIIESHDYSNREQCETAQKVARPSFSELMRPQALSDLTLPMAVIERLEKMVETNSIMDMLFVGESGTGKTSAAYLFKNFADLNPILRDTRLFLQWDGLAVKDAAWIRDNMGFDGFFGAGGFTIGFLDHAELVPEAVQQPIATWIDGLGATNRVILATNDISKIIPELHSRLMPIYFDIEPARSAEVQTRLFERYESKLAEYSNPCDPRRLREIIADNYPDLRSIAQEIQFELV